MEFENQVLLGDCLTVLRQLPDDTYDSCVTDVPYGLGDEPTVEEIVSYLMGADLVTGDFMGKDWDIPSVLVWREVYRTLKPGAHVLCFGGTRTWDLISLGARAAGFEYRDTIASDHPALQWKHGQGFPKSHSIGKAVDAKLGATREVVGLRPTHYPDSPSGYGSVSGNGGTREGGMFGEVTGEVQAGRPVTAPATEEAAQWDGWGTALKPSWEPILVFRKPFKGTIADNVLKYGTGGLNIDATRVRHSSPEDFEKHKAMVDRLKEQGGQLGNSWKNTSDLSGANEVKEGGRWPPNSVMRHSELCQKVGTKVIPPHPQGPDRFQKTSGGTFSESYGNQLAQDQPEELPVYDCVEGCPVRALDEQSGDKTGCGSSGPRPNTYERTDDQSTSFQPSQGTLYADKGGASRFFPQFEGQKSVEVPFFYTAKASKKETTIDGQIENNHPTKKPVALMRWLVKLVTPKGGITLDPYCGSGSTLHAAIEERVRFTGIERDPHFHEISTKRTELVLQSNKDKHSGQDLFERMMEMSEEDLEAAMNGS
jgi:DNA modification methylase